MLNSFTRHPAAVGESYGEHLIVALSFSGRLLKAALAASIHALVPCWCEKTASSIIVELNREMVTHRNRGQSAKPTENTTERQMPMAQ